MNLKIVEQQKKIHRGKEEKEEKEKKEKEERRIAPGGNRGPHKGWRALEKMLTV